MGVRLDRMPSSFKQILRVASVAGDEFLRRETPDIDNHIGQYFALSEVLAVLKDTQQTLDGFTPWGSVKQLMDYIRQADNLQMLILASDLSAADRAQSLQSLRKKPGRSLLSQGTLRGSSLGSNPFDIPVAFRHCFLQQCVYASLMPEKREYFHGAFANYYERTMTSANKAHHLPLLSKSLTYKYLLENNPILVFHLEHVPGEGKRKLIWAEKAFMFYAEELRMIDTGFDAYDRLERLMQEYPQVR